MKRILIPTDFSKNAYCALFYAAKLFEDEPCRFIIFNSFEAQIKGFIRPNIQPLKKINPYKHSVYKGF